MLKVALLTLQNGRLRPFQRVAATDDNGGDPRAKGFCNLFHSYRRIFEHIVQEASNGEVFVSSAFEHECSNSEQVRDVRNTRPFANLIAMRGHSELHGIRDPNGHRHRTALNLETLSVFLGVAQRFSFALDFTGIRHRLPRNRLWGA